MYSKSKMLICHMFGLHELVSFLRMLKDKIRLLKDKIRHVLFCQDFEPVGPQPARAEDETAVRSVICRGFNQYFGVPEIKNRRARYRTAVILKKTDWLDAYQAYEAIIRRIIQRVSDEAFSGKMEIDCPESPNGFVRSLSELREVEVAQAAEDPEFVPDALTEIRFFSGDCCACLMSLEDWSDIGKVEPYAVSYTYSFYSVDEDIDYRIARLIRRQLSGERDVCEIKECVESMSPKWYWPILRILKILKTSIWIVTLAVIIVLIYCYFVFGTAIEIHSEDRALVKGDAIVGGRCVCMEHYERSELWNCRVRCY